MCFDLMYVGFTGFLKVAESVKPLKNGNQSAPNEYSCNTWTWKQVIS